MSASAEISDLLQLFAPERYTDGAAELAGHLARIHQVLQCAVQRFRRMRNPSIGPALNGVAVFDAEIDDFLTADPATLCDPRYFSNAIGDFSDLLANGRLHCEQRARASAAVGVLLPLTQMQKRFRLSGAELDILLLCVAWEIHPGYGRLYAYLHNDLERSRPSIGLALDVLAEDWTARLALRRLLLPDAPLFRHGLIVGQRGAGLALEIAVDPTVLETVLGAPSARNLVEVPPIAFERLLVDDTERTRLAELVDGLDPSECAEDTPTFVVLSGPAGVGRRTAAAAVCARAGHRLFVFERVIADTATLPQVRLWLRDVGVAGGLAALRLSPALTEREDAFTALSDAVSGVGGGIVFILIDADTRPHWPNDVRTLTLDLKPPSAELRRTAWREAVRELRLACSEDDLQAVAAVYPFTVGSIRRTMRDAAERLRIRDARASQIGRSAMIEACRGRAHHGLGRLAQRLIARHDWNDIVLPPDEIQRLREIANAVRHRELVQERWGFDGVGSARGINALFFGPSGTGKTMAATILANDLGMEVYRVDLSRVVSKYIGETERNLDAIFDEARRAFALLFFDEAEALFGKRSEVKDAHDRYANIEVAYLLQRMEVFDGVAILATNLRKNMDSAFTRRLQFAVEFPLPAYGERLRIWQQVWPKAAAVASDLDLDFMARNFELAGGHIRNIALTAAYLAAQREGPLCMASLVVATRREFQKLGRLCLDEQFGPYAHLAKGLVQP